MICSSRALKKKEKDVSDKAGKGGYYMPESRNAVIDDWFKFEKEKGKKGWVKRVS